MPSKPLNRYEKLIEKVFFDHYRSKDTEVHFTRSELIANAEELGISIPKNPGDIIYAFRYRVPLPKSILAKQPRKKEWVIEGTGRAKYAFKLVQLNRIAPNPDLITIKLPDSTPEIIAKYALSDEQALLAKVRYNRLIDIFLGVAAYSMQNHLRTSVKGTGQVEIDEIYTAIDSKGRHYIIPVQAKGGSDQLSVIQTKQDIECCSQKFPDLICRPISTQFIEDDLIAIFELTLEDEQIKVVSEKHYRLVPSSEISSEDLRI